MSGSSVWLEIVGMGVLVVVDLAVVVVVVGLVVVVVVVVGLTVLAVEVFMTKVGETLG